MTAAYAGVVSLMHLMEQIQLYHAHQSIFLDEQQSQLEALRQKVSFLQDFLESFSHIEGCKESKDSEIRIANATYAAEDIIETHIVDDIHARSTNSGKPSSERFSHELEKLIEQIDFIKKDAAKIKEKNELTDHQLRELEHVDSSRPPIAEEPVVIFDDGAIQIMGELTSGQQSDRQIISITGMGGIGKTTLAKYIYDNSLIKETFDICGWLTVSQEYNVQELLLGVLREITGQTEQEHSEYFQLGERLHRYLSGRKYLIVMDDLWSMEAWDKLKFYLPDNNNSSRIMITTRLSNVAKDVSSSNPYNMNLLNENKSWSLLCSKVFPQDCCPPELEEIGKKIAEKCRGLPLSIVVIGGLLAKTKTRKYWEHIAEAIHTSIALEDDEHCLNLLSLSYSHLPIYLKPCFLYFGVFPEDDEIHVSQLTKLWVAEGFLKPSNVKSSEEVAEDFLKDLIDRNLVFVSKLGSTGQLKRCKIHDLLRDLCLREARNERFLYVTDVHDPDTSQGINNQLRRIVIQGSSTSDEKQPPQVSDVLQSALFPRSLTCNLKLDLPLSLNFVLLRILNVIDEYPEEAILQLLNSRYIKSCIQLSTWKLPSSICLLWNIQTLALTTNKLEINAPPEIWEMAQLRHIIIQTVHLPKPKSGHGVVLENLQTLSYVMHFNCTEDVVRKIPNIKKLKISNWRKPKRELSHYCLQNLDRLQKLQVLKCGFPPRRKWTTREELLKNLIFPVSLKKLALFYCNLRWEDIETKIGLLPNLEKLLLTNCFVGSNKWETVEGQFLSLKILEINDGSLVYWTAESSHFPRLERLVLRSMTKLKKIPSDIGYIETLGSIALGSCSSSAATSAKKILKEQQSLENNGLRIWVNGEPVEAETDTDTDANTDEEATIDDDDNDDDDDDDHVHDNGDDDDDPYGMRLLFPQITIELLSSPPPPPPPRGNGGVVLVSVVVLFCFFLYRVAL